jgi:threonine/homoserine/homoserine lactone efflux protein
MTVIERCGRIFQFIFGGVFVLAGLAIIGLQIFAYLYDGKWVPLSVVGLASQFASSPWLADPHTWVGVHKILEFIPASFSLMAIGIFIWCAE